MAKAAAKKSTKVKAVAPKKVVAKPVKAAAVKPAKEAKPAAAAAAAPSAAPSGTGVHIISNKVCQAFGTRAAGLKAEILRLKPGTAVTIDEQKALGRNPDKGTFAVLVNGKVHVEKSV
jgi:hypothetical protein